MTEWTKQIASNAAKMRDKRPRGSARMILYYNMLRDIGMLTIRHRGNYNQTAKHVRV